MEAYLNRAGVVCHRRWLAISAVCCLSGALSAADPTGKASPQRIPKAAATKVALLKSAAGRDPSLFICEPDPLPEGWAQVPSKEPLGWATGGSAVRAAEAMIESNRYAPLPGFSTASLRQAAATQLDEAAARLAHDASYSAAAAAMNSLRLIAQSNDSAQGDSRCSTELMSAMVAIREAEDFVGRYGYVDASAIERMVRSHETKVLKGATTSSYTGLMAADIYLDSARQTLAVMASQDALAATAIGLLAKSYRQRAAESPLALATSVHLMRAAVSASPRDTGLAVELASVLQQAKMHAEARQVLASTSQIRPLRDASDISSDEAVIAVVNGTQTGGLSSEGQQQVRIEQLSPAAFATISRAEAGPVVSSGSPAPGATATPAAAKGESKPESGAGQAISRSFKSMTRMWR